jgi:MoaA/NifB/PqqE/SkfB family radical SAM enzyme
MLENLKTQLATRRNILAEIPAIVSGCVSTNIIKRFKPLKPTVLQVNVNATCNARCCMCNIWKTEDKTMLSLAELDKIFSDPLFRTIEYSIVAGGEPTLRKDLPELVIQMLKKMPKMRKISIPTTGIATERSVSHFSTIAKACLEHKVFLSIGISMDGVEGVYDRVRGVPGGYQKVINTLVALKKLNQEVEFQLGIGSTISALNVYDVYNLIEVSKKLELGVRGGGPVGLVFQQCEFAGQHYLHTRGQRFSQKISQTTDR